MTFFNWKFSLGVPSHNTGQAEKTFGFASFQYNYPKNKNTKIHKIYVLPEAQGKNIGKILMGKITDFAIENNQNSLSLNVNRNNVAIEFYNKLGFKKSYQEDIEIGNGYLMEDFVMEKSI